MKYILIMILSLVLSSCASLQEERIRQNIAKVDALVIVHPTSYFDSLEEAKIGINFIANIFLRYKKKVYTFVETQELIDSISRNSQDEKSLGYSKYLTKINSTEMLPSLNGENNLKIRGKNIVVVGGYLLACLRTALKDLSESNLNEKKVLNIYLPLRAIYGKEIAKNTRPTNMGQLKRRIRSFIPKDFNVEVYRDSKVIIKIKGTGTKVVRLYLRVAKDIHYPHEKF